MNKRTIVLLAGICITHMAEASDPGWKGKLEAAMQSPIRTAAEVARDPNRQPWETLAFMGFRDDLRVLELFPGTGWYTKLLGPVLADKGRLYLALGTDRIRDVLSRTPELSMVELLDVNPVMTSTDTQGVFDLETFSFWVEDLDMVLTFRNAHNLTPAGRTSLNEAVFEALRPGGLYGVVDHTRRHMEPDGPANARRADPVRIVHEAVQAGFEFVAWTDLHRRAGDALQYEVGRPSVKGNTDRFTLLFRKPQ